MVEGFLHNTIVLLPHTLTYTVILIILMTLLSTVLTGWCIILYIYIGKILCSRSVAFYIQVVIITAWLWYS